MSQTSITIEIERPRCWAGEPVDENDKSALDFFEIDVEGFVRVDYEKNYGCDADGNRGYPQTFVDVEDVTFTLYGDFRPWRIKVRDFFLVRSINARRFFAHWRKHGRPSTMFVHVGWTQFSGFNCVSIDEADISKGEYDEAVDCLEQECWDCTWDDADRY